MATSAISSLPTEPAPGVAADLLVILAVDHIGMVRAQANQLRQAAASAAGTRPERVMICFSHTHLGPDTGGVDWYGVIRPQDSVERVYGGTLEAAEAVCAGVGIAAGDVLDLLGRLVDKSLVQAQDVGMEGRYRLLETVRQYAGERLPAGEVALLRDRHLAWCVDLAEGSELPLLGSEQERWLERLETEHDNLRLALSWAQARGVADLWLRLAAALWPFWIKRDYFAEGRHWLEAALAASTEGDPALRARALNAAGSLATEQGDFAREVVLQEEALALWRCG